MSLFGLVLAVIPLSPLVWPSEPTLPPAVMAGKPVPVGTIALRKLVADLQPSVAVFAWRPKALMVTVRLSLRNPGKDWLTRVRVDVTADDKQGFGRPVSSSFLFDYLAPGQTSSRESDRMLMRVPTAAMGQVQYVAKAKVVGGATIELKR